MVWPLTRDFWLVNHAQGVAQLDQCQAGLRKLDLGSRIQITDAGIGNFLTLATNCKVDFFIHDASKDRQCAFRLEMLALVGYGSKLRALAFGRWLLFLCLFRCRPRYSVTTSIRLEQPRFTLDPSSRMRRHAC
eukprot:g65222.t1